MIAEAVPVVQHAYSLAGKARADHRVRAPVDNGSHEPGQITGIVLEIRVLTNDHVSRCALNPGPNSEAFPAIPFLRDEHVDLFFGEEALENRAGSVR